MCCGGKRGRGQTAEIRETFRKETTEKRAKTTQNVFTASLLRLYFLFTYSVLQSDTSNFPLVKVRKTCVKHRTWWVGRLSTEDTEGTEISVSSVLSVDREKHRMNRMKRKTKIRVIREIR